MDMAKLHRVASTKEDLSAAPDSVKRTMGFALWLAQKGDLRDVMEVRDDDESGTYRLMYTAKLSDVVYVLDYFQKKGTSGGATPKVDLDRVRQRLKRAREKHAARSRR